MNLTLTDQLQESVRRIKAEVEGMRAYLLLKYHAEDWHGVMDAAADIRELVAHQRALESLLARAAS